MTNRQIIGLNLNEIEAIVARMGYSTNLGRKICTWLYRKRCASFSEMVDIPLSLRNSLSNSFVVSNLKPEKVAISSDGTRKYLFKTLNDNPFETAFIPDSKRKTLCISTQSGCKVGCSFCYTGLLGFFENLDPFHIISQLFSVEESININRLVLMGMGEPLDNFQNVLKSLSILNSQWGIAFGASNITLSTVGIIPHIKTLINSRNCNIAISLHSPFPEERLEIVPAEKDNPIREIVALFQQEPIKKPLRLSFEYVVVPGLNNSQNHAKELDILLKGLNCHINIIPLNTNKTNSSHTADAEAFQRNLKGLGLKTTLRLSRGQNISAACGMMVGKK